jgi:adenine-specific DNA methylase/REP element-mobilizing transposase RayT
MSEQRNNAHDCPRLIEVALPIREISAESVRDKSLRHGHISTLHLWWARRPLAASRAVVFASLVPDPDDPRCPAYFRAAVERHLKTHVPAELKHYYRGRQVHRDEDPYRPYAGMPDTLRNRLLTFIAKWSPESLAFEAGKAKKEPEPKYLLDDRSLVKWETSDPANAQGREVLRIARELVKVAHVGQASSLSASSCFVPFDPESPIGRHARHLPHWRQEGVTYFVTFRLADSMPQEKLSAWHSERETWLSENPEPHTTEQRRAYHERFTDKFHQWLDAGDGSCALQKPEVGRLVETALKHFDGQRYRLGDYVVMPNHVHVLLTPLGAHTLSDILHSWKSYTATQINRLLNKAGKFWQDESFDHIVRKPEHLQRYKEYIRANPAKAGLKSGFIVGCGSASISDSQDGRPTIIDSQDGCPTGCPTVLDPFAGGGAIPLEAGRLGCQAIANDYNPVAYLILRATCEFPQKYGKPGMRRSPIEDWRLPIFEQSEIDNRKSQIREVPNVLAHDVEQWARWILERAREKIGHLYPPGRDGRPVVGYLWARTAPCSNPSCRGEIPLLRSLLVCNKKDKQVALTMEVVVGQASSLQKKGNRQDACPPTIKFGIAEGAAIKKTDGTMQNRGNTLCPYCGQVTPVADLRTAGLEGRMGEQMVAVITEDKGGKRYRPVEEADLAAFRAAAAMEVERPSEPIEEGQWNIKTWLYGMKTWGSLFNPRQLVAMQTFVGCLLEALERMKAVEQAPSLHKNSLDGCPPTIADEEYRKAVGVYLGLWLSRIAQRSSNVGLWDTTRETLQHPFGRQAIPMTWDYPEANPFSESTGGAVGGLDWMTRVILHESTGGRPAAVTRGDGAALSLDTASCDVVVTDPPYFDAIAYGDLSDYFYVWLKRGLAGVIPEALVTPLTPKVDEATALKHRHAGDGGKADAHFKSKLAAVLAETHRVMKPDGVISIMFAHQSTKAWTALVTAIFEAGLTVDATWPIDTELTTALKASMSALSSSVTVICRPRVVGSAAAFRQVRKEIEQVVQESVKRFWSYGFRGADLIVACYGPAVGVFGKYERVEKADGTPVGIPELLDLAKQAARDAIAGEFRGDNLSTLYYVWANLYGAAEQAWDDARLVVQIGGNEDNAMEVARGHGIFVVDGARCRLALLADREKIVGGQPSRLRVSEAGKMPALPLIDALHRSMLLWKAEKRQDLVSYLTERGLLEDGPFWKLAQALFEVLPRDLEDWKLVGALLGERQTLRAEGKREAFKDAQKTLF